MRIQSIVHELGGEKIDVVAWHPDDPTFISNSLSPAKVRYVVLDPNSSPRTATVVVPDDQLSLAIGKEGQNARLAAKLTGWRIDIKNETIAAREDIRPRDHVATVAGDGRDILAMAEAILLGKKPPEKAQEPELVESEPKPEPVAVETETEPVQVDAEPALVQAEPEPVLEETTEAVEQAEVPAPAVAAVEEPEPEEAPVEQPVAVAAAPVQKEEKQEIKAVEPKPQPRRGKPKYVYVEDEELKDVETSKKKARRRRRRLVRDEESGELVVERRHKREQDDEMDWETFLDR
jgi:N utilization substance protein A